MSFYAAPPAQAHSLRSPQLILQQFLQAEGLPFADVLTAEDIRRAFEEEGVHFGQTEDALYTPEVTLWAFLSQAISQDKTCAAAVLRVMALLVALGHAPCSENTGAYCKARAKLSEAALQRLALETAWRLEDDAPDKWRWQGKRRVFLLDGSTLTLCDTPENQAAYPQANTQQPGLGFPILRIVKAFSLATGAVCGAHWGPYQGKETGETALARELLDLFEPGDVLVADSHYCSYWIVALAQQRGLEVVFRQHHKRKTDFAQGRRLGRRDHVVRWKKGPRPKWMDQAMYDSLPDELVMRECEVRVEQDGFRTRQYVVATTFLDPEEVDREALAELYRARWNAELDIRSLKQQMRLEPLSCKTPAMAHKELWAHLLAYTLVRKVIAQAAAGRSVLPRQISFTGARQALTELRESLTYASRERLLCLGETLLARIARRRVGERPDRVEPRAIKRRPKPHDLLTEPRAAARAKLQAA
jgi:hypothetical protein